LRVNKVAGNINLSPGRSFQSSSRNIYELVPYLRNDGNRHDFSHAIHEFSFMGDDEYNPSKERYGKDIKSRLGLGPNPLDGTSGRVRSLSFPLSYDFVADELCHRLPKLSICSSIF
jgi:endoplasmic reticulum-Golgi intermediate compartment protein 3